MSHSITEVVSKIKNFILDKDNGVLSTIAPVETSTTSSREYTAGKRLYLNRILYDVVDTINIGDTLSTQTNITPCDSLSDVINTKSKKPVMHTRILLPGVTTLTFTIVDTGNVFVDFFTDAGIGYTNVSVSGSNVTVTFEPQSLNVTVYCLVQEL